MLTHCAFDDFTSGRNAILNVFSQVISVVVIFVLVPIFSGKLNWHESTILVVHESGKATHYLQS
jgi:hypothetical protein